MSERGNSDSAFIIGIVVLLVFAWIGMAVSPEKSGSNTRSNSLVGSRSSGSAGPVAEAEEDPTKSVYWGKVDIATGNARSAFQTYLEYITIRRDSSRETEPINITGWTVQNGASDRRYQLGDATFFGNSARVPIPQGASLFIPNAQNTLGPILLMPGEKAVLVTGSMPPVTNFPITSFKVNKCSGYLEELDDVRFSPAISRSCPTYRDYPEVRSFEKSCYDFIRRIPACHTPEFKDARRSDGGYEVGAVDGVLGLTSQCKAFIQTTFNYNSCVAKHINDEDFYKKEWRVFLNQPWELWAKEREDITLYDQFGKIVDQYSY